MLNFNFLNGCLKLFPGIENAFIYEYWLKFRQVKHK